MINRDVVERVRLAVLLDCLVAVGRCRCQECSPDTAVMLARVLVVPGATEECPCRVVAVDDVPPWRRPLGLDCPPAALGYVNLGDLLGQRVEGAALEIVRRGLEIGGTSEFVPTNPSHWNRLRLPPIFEFNSPVEILWFEDECLGRLAVGFYSGRRAARWDAIRSDEVGEEATVPEAPAPAPPPAAPLMRIEGMTPRRLEILADQGIASYEAMAAAEDAVLRRAFRARTSSDLDVIREQARRFAEEERA